MSELAVNRHQTTEAGSAPDPADIASRDDDVAAGDRRWFHAASRTGSSDTTRKRARGGRTVGPPRSIVPNRPKSFENARLASIRASELPAQV